MPNKQQLNFELKLRNYKNLSDFYTHKPWLYPPIRDFSPAKQLARERNEINLLNQDYRTKFSEKFGERNIAYILN